MYFLKLQVNSLLHSLKKMNLVFQKALGHTQQNILVQVQANIHHDIHLQESMPQGLLLANNVF